MPIDLEFPTKLEMCDIFREFFPNATDQEAHDIMINYTGYPCWFNGEPKEALRAQLTELKEIGLDGVLEKRERQEAAINAMRRLWEHLKAQNLGFKNTTAFLSLSQIPGQPKDEFEALAQEMGLYVFRG